MTEFWSSNSSSLAAGMLETGATDSGPTLQVHYLTEDSVQCYADRRILLVSPLDQVFVHFIKFAFR